jgi:hypothetical protein
VPVPVPVVYRRSGGLPAFVEASAPTDDELHALLQTLITRLMKMPTRRGAPIEEMAQTSLADLDADGEEARTLRAAAGGGRCLPHRLRAPLGLG